MDLTINKNDEQSNVKILIICDTTGSMSVALSALTTFFNEIQPFLKLVFHNVKCGCVLYADYDSVCTGECPVYVQDFTSDIDKSISKQLKGGTNHTKKNKNIKHLNKTLKNYYD